MSQPIDTATVKIVPDFSAFGAEAKAGVDSQLRSLGASVQTAMSSVEREVSEAGREIGSSFQTGGNEAQTALRGVATQAKQSFDSVERQADSAANSIGSRLGGALSVVKAGLLTLGAGVATGLVAITTFGLKSAASLEQTQIAFNSLLGGVKAGTAAMADLQKFAAVTPFEFKDVAGAAQRFYTFADATGIAKDHVDDFLTTIGNVASVTGGGAQALNSVTLAMGQITSSGKLTLDNLNQISEALPGFSGVAAIASATGKSTADVMQEISAGSIDASTGIQALLAGMKTFPGAAGAMEAQSQTLLGVFSTFKDTLSQALVAGFKPVIPALKDSLTQITPVFGQALAQIAPAIGGILSGVLPIFAHLLTAVAPILSSLLGGIGDALADLANTGALEQLGTAISEVVAALRPLLPALVPVIVALVQGFAPIIAALAPIAVQLVGPIIDIVNAFLPLVPVLGQLIASLLLLVVPLVQAVAAFLSFVSIEGLTPIIKLLAIAIGFAAKAVGEFAQWLMSVNWKQIGDDIGGAFSSAWDAVVGFFKGIGDWFDALPGKIGDALSALPGLLVGLANQAFDMFFQAIGFGIGTIIAGVKAFPALFGGFIKQLWDDAVNLFKFGVANIIFIVTQLVPDFLSYIDSLWKQTKQKFSDGVDNAVDFVKSIPHRVKVFLDQLVNQFTGVGGNIIDGLVNGLENAVGRAVAAVKRAMGDIVDGAKKALGIASPSLVFATEVGAWIPPGIGQGIQDAMPDLHSLLAGATAGLPGAAQPSGGTAALGGSMFGPGSIVINFNGATPSPAQATAVGQAVGGGIADGMTKRGIATTARTV